MKLTNNLLALTIIFLLSITPNLLAQSDNISQRDSMYISTNITLEIYSFNFNQAHSIINNFISDNDIKIENQQVVKNKSLNLTIKINNNQYHILEQIIPKLGYINSKNIITKNNSKTVKEILLELDYLKTNKKSYETVLTQIEKNSEEYLSIWQELKTIEKDIFVQEKRMLSFTNKLNSYTIILNLKDEISSPQYTGVNFVNMPGFEYSYLQIESPLKGISTENYTGYMLKYLFTKGKTFAILGAFKSINDDYSTDNIFSELFVIGFGQDYYSRFLGRGANTFLNLYTGYTIGYMLAMGETRKTSSTYISPSIGLELFKNKYILLDTKINYFVPFTYNKNLRGINYSLSFNFIF